MGKSSVGYEIFQQVYRSGIKVAYVDLDQVGLCYPSPADDPHNQPLRAGEIISTGTLTLAMSVSAGQTWTTRVRDIPLEDVTVRFEA